MVLPGFSFHREEVNIRGIHFSLKSENSPLVANITLIKPLIGSVGL